MRCHAVVAALVLTLALLIETGARAFQAAGRDEMVLTVAVSSAEHEAQEGYFTLGDSATLMVKPGSELYKFLSRHRGRKVRVAFSDAAPPGPARLER